MTLPGESPQFTFEDRDAYVVTLTVTDRAGNRDTDTLTVTFAPQEATEFSWWLVPLLVIIIILSLLVFLVWRKKREDESEEIDEK